MGKTLAMYAAHLQALCDASAITTGLRAVVARGGIDLLRDEANATGQPSPYRQGRLSVLGPGLFGLSIVRHTGRLEKVPFSGSVDMLHEAMEGPLAHVFGGLRGRVAAASQESRNGDLLD